MIRSGAFIHARCADAILTTSYLGYLCTDSTKTRLHVLGLSLYTEISLSSQSNQETKIQRLPRACYGDKSEKRQAVASQSLNQNMELEGSADPIGELGVLNSWTRFCDDS